jgi:endonuclease YncB( thermonuclease family)
MLGGGHAKGRLLVPRSAWALAGIALLAVAVSPAAAAAANLRSYAIVQDDASLRVRGETVRLYGIYITTGERVCLTDVRPVRCGTRAARALRQRIQGFVDCAPQARLADGSLSAICTIRHGSLLDPPLDLGAWLIAEGLAVAGPGAPFEYGVLERIAQSQRRGLWGFQVDVAR